MKSKRMTYLDYNLIAMRLDALVDAVKAESFQAIISIVRGGNFPSSHMSVRTGLPIFYLRHDEDQTVSWIGEAPTDKNVLICEDLAGSGHTLLNCQKFLRTNGYNYKTLVIFKDTKSASTPEFICFETKDPNEVFILPWEKFRLNPRAHSEMNGYLEDHKFEMTGWDMDGVFLEDVPSEIYAAGLENALLVRDRYPLASFAPKLVGQNVIITGRPTIDEERTYNWLALNHINVPLYLRDDGILKPDKKSTALWKGKKAVEVGCSRYVESDCEQATHIAAHFPHLEVIWWNQGNPITMKASSLSIRPEPVLMA